MKKLLLRWITQQSEVNLEENKNSILRLLQTSNFISLSVTQKIDLFKKVESEFCDILAKDNIDAEITISEIDKFSRDRANKNELIKNNNNGKL